MLIDVGVFVGLSVSHTILNYYFAIDTVLDDLTRKLFVLEIQHHSNSCLICFRILSKKVCSRRGLDFTNIKLQAAPFSCRNRNCHPDISHHHCWLLISRKLLWVKMTLKAE